jgi:hypothetical protein
LPRACSRTATVAPLLDVAQTLIDDLGGDAQRLQLFDVFAAAGGTDQARLLRRVVVRLDAQHVAAQARADHRLRRGAAPHAVAAQGQRHASLSLLNTMLAFAHRHARQRNALALLESGMQLLFFTYRRDNNAAVRPVCAAASTRCSGARSSCRSVLP